MITFDPDNMTDTEPGMVAVDATAETIHALGKTPFEIACNAHDIGFADGMSAVAQTLQEDLDAGVTTDVPMVVAALREATTVLRRQVSTKIDRRFFETTEEN